MHVASLLIFIRDCSKIKTRLIGNMKNRLTITIIFLFVFFAVLISVIIVVNKPAEPSINQNTNNEIAIGNANLNINVNEADYPDYPGYEKVFLPGYLLTCAEHVKVHALRNDNWEEVINDFSITDTYPAFYVNDQPNFSQCDVLICNKNEKPLYLHLVEYLKIGEKLAPNSTENFWPVFESKNLIGEIKVELDVYTDDQCQNKQRYSKIISI